MFNGRERKEKKRKKRKKKKEDRRKEKERKKKGGRGGGRGGENAMLTSALDVASGTNGGGSCGRDLARGGSVPRGSDRILDRGSGRGGSDLQDAGGRGDG